MIVVLFVAAAAAVAMGREPVPTYTIDLDTKPEDRFAHIVPHVNKTVWGFWDKYFANDKLLTDALFLLTDLRGKEPQELQAEVEGLASASKLPLKFVQAVQMLYELQTMMVPVVNFSKATAAGAALPAAANLTAAAAGVPSGWEALARIPWRGPGCTGIIAQDSADGAVYHARNLDFAPVEFMKPLTYVGVFTRGGKELYRAQMIAGYSLAVTGMRRGPDGFVIERNTRYTDHAGGNKEMLRNLLSGRQLNGWTVRKTLESCADYACAVKMLSTQPYASTEYAIVSGVKKGTILCRSPDSVAHTLVLPPPPPPPPPSATAPLAATRSSYIIITNFDFFWNDAREWFDPTGGRMFRPRRLVAQKILDASPVLTP